MVPRPQLQLGASHVGDARLDIPKEVISKGLGHSFGLSVTDIDFDNSKVDEANRRVIDYVLYGRDYRKEKPRH